jgi:hypothetical protein
MFLGHVVVATLGVLLSALVLALLVIATDGMIDRVEQDAGS